MKNIKLIPSALFLLLLTWSCNENPIDNEQYKKQIYIVGAIDKVYTPVLYYNDTAWQETFIAVAGSGSLPLEKDADVVLEIVPDAIPIYNEKYIGRWANKPYYSVLPTDFYRIASLEATLKANGTISERIPVLINTSAIHCDSLYAIPFNIKSATEYPVNTEIATLLLSFKVENEYSASYQMTGTKTKLSDGTMSRSGKTKALKAVNEHSVRMFFFDSKDDDKTLIATTSLILTIDAKNNVTVTPWNADKLNVSLMESGGTYDPKLKEFNIWYTYKDASDIEYKITEILQNK